MRRSFTTALWATFGVLVGAALFVVTALVCTFAGTPTQGIVLAFALLSLYALTKRGGAGC